MTTVKEEIKICPSCRNPTPFSQCKKIVSRSSGKTTNSWRCLACINRKKAAFK